jgi:hypothetical protein
MAWQDLALGAAGFVFFVSLLPSVLDTRTRISRRTSIPTSVGVVWVQTFAFATLGLWVTAATTAAVGLCWTYIAWRRPLLPL